MALQTLILIFKTDKPVEEDAGKLRGFIGNHFKDHQTLHNHTEGAGFVYSYPRIQYKILDGTPVILGIGEGVRVLKEISGGIEQLELGKSMYKVSSIQMNQLNIEIGATDNALYYRFLTPWLALSQENYYNYQNICNWKDRKIFLNRILVGNVLSMCKGLGLRVDKQLDAHTHLEEQIVEYKGIMHQGFVGQFKINFMIPDMFGLGKGVSQGFGISRLRQDQNEPIR